MSCEDVLVKAIVFGFTGLSTGVFLAFIWWRESRAATKDKNKYIKELAVVEHKYQMLLLEK